MRANLFASSLLLGRQDFVARLIAQNISSSLGQNMVVDNRWANLVGDRVAKAPPDGTTLLAVGNAFMVDPLLQESVYEPLMDLSPISFTAPTPA
jgi:tripartite-type tricarboxylate transporter receptor subunit TctC